MFLDNAALSASLEDLCAKSSDSIVANFAESNFVAVTEDKYVEAAFGFKEGYMDIFRWSCGFH